MKVFSRFELIRKMTENIFFEISRCSKENDHKPRTVLEQLYNYKGGIVPDTKEAEKTNAPQQV